MRTILAAVLSLATAVVACSTGGGTIVRRGDGLEAQRLPPEVQGDYALFAQRCSKCHTLAKPLNTDVDDDAWVAYVARMRRMPGSGISPNDAQGILRFLHFYSAAQRRAKAERTTDAGPPADDAGRGTP